MEYLGSQWRSRSALKGEVQQGDNKKEKKNSKEQKKDGETDLENRLHRRERGSRVLCGEHLNYGTAEAPDVRRLLRVPAPLDNLWRHPEHRTWCLITG
jgi:hypothetical protein